MQFSTIFSAALLALTVTAVPTPVDTALSTESITIDSVYIRNIDSTISSTSFNITSPSVLCTSSGTPTGVTSCSDSTYSFYLQENNLSSYNLTIYHALGVGYGLYQQQDVTLNCRAGGSAASDYVCQNTSPIEYTLSFDGTQ